ncbi:MBL fold metallo-hydrolase [Candidatus Hodarchaeum mangrovi]
MFENDSRLSEILKKIKDGKNYNITDIGLDFTSEQKDFLFLGLINTPLIDHEYFTTERTIWVKIKDLFKNDYQELEILTENWKKTTNMTIIALQNSIFDFEDYRTVIRYLYTNSNDLEEVVLHSSESILKYLKNNKFNPPYFPNYLALMRFIGIPLPKIEKFIPQFCNIFPHKKDEINNFQKTHIKAIDNYSQYLEDIVSEIAYDVEEISLKTYFDHETLSRVLNLKVNDFIEFWKPIKRFNDIEEFSKEINPVIKENQLSLVPFVFNSFIRPYASFIASKTIQQDKIPQNIPSEALNPFLEKLAFPIYSKPEDKVIIKFLGGETIGTMGILIKTSMSIILIDYGMSIANYQVPIWDEALNYLDAILVSHSHLDHIGAIPYLFGLGYSGYVYGSAMSKNLAKFLLLDNQNLMNRNTSNLVRTVDPRFKHLSNESNIIQLLDRFITLSSSKTYNLTPDIAITPIPAHHIQGSYAYKLEIGNKSILFSGDANLDPSALFNNEGANLPTDADLTIMDCTYYNQESFDTKKRDSLLFETVKESKRVIIPAFSVGRAQEILLKLDKAGLTAERKVSLLGMATKVARLTGISTKGYLSDNLIPPFDDQVVITGGGMLGGGYARELVEETKTDSDTSIILCGFLAKNTLAYRLLHKMEPDYKQKIVYARFSGHSSNDTLQKYLSSVKGEKILIHLGALSTDPLQLEQLRKTPIFNVSSLKIPELGSSIEI